MRWTENPPWLGRIKCHNQQHQQTVQVHFYKFFFYFFVVKLNAGPIHTNHNNKKVSICIFFTLSLSSYSAVHCFLDSSFLSLKQLIFFFFLPQVKFCFFFNVLKNFFPFLYFNFFFFTPQSVLIERAFQVTIPTLEYIH